MVHLSWISTGMIVLGVCTLIITLLYVRNDIATREYQRLESLRGSRWPVGESPVDLFDSRDWLAWQFGWKGMPKGYNILGFLGLATLLLTEFQSLAVAGCVLCIVWGMVNVRDPANSSESVR